MLRDASLPFMLLQLELLRQLNTKERRHPVLIASAAPQQYVWIETVVLAILRLAIREAGKPTETSPVGGARVSLISTSEGPSHERRDICAEDMIMLQATLESFLHESNHPTRPEIVRCEPVN